MALRDYPAIDDAKKQLDLLFELAMEALLKRLPNPIHKMDAAEHRRKIYASHDRGVRMLRDQAKLLADDKQARALDAAHLRVEREPVDTAALDQCVADFKVALARYRDAWKAFDPQRFTPEEYAEVQAATRKAQAAKAKMGRASDLLLRTAASKLHPL